MRNLNEMLQKDFQDTNFNENIKCHRRICYYTIYPRKHLCTHMWICKYKEIIFVCVRGFDVLRTYYKKEVHTPKSICNLDVLKH